MYFVHRRSKNRFVKLIIDRMSQIRAIQIQPRKRARDTHVAGKGDYEDLPSSGSQEIPQRRSADF